MYPPSPMSGCYAVFHKQLGDVVLLQPALEKLSDLHGGPVCLLTRTGHEPVVELMPGVSMTRGAALVPRKALYCFDPLNKSALRSLFAPAGKKHCVLPDKAKIDWRHRLVFGRIDAPGLNDDYVAEYFWNCIPSRDLKSFTPPRLNRPPESWKPTWYDGQPFILVNPTAGWKRKSWLADRWAACLDSLSSHIPAGFIITSGSDDWQRSHCEKIVRKSKSTHPPLLAPSTSLKEFLWLCANAAAVLSVDGSAAHIANAFSTPSLAIFGPTSMANWHKETSQAKAVQAPVSPEDGVRHLKNLETQVVIDACGPFIGSLN